jgi:hypothetical protein
MNTQTSVTARSLVAKAEQNPMGFTMDAQGNDVSGAYYVIGTLETKNSHNLDGAMHCLEVMAKLMEEKPNVNLAFGGWMDADGMFHFDVVYLVHKEDVTEGGAMSIGYANEQIAIFDLENYQEINL